MLCCFSSKIKYTFIADPDDLLINNINTIFLNDDRYRIIDKKAHIIKKCNKYYNIWNYTIVRTLTNRRHLLITSSREKNLWVVVDYNEEYMNILPTKIPTRFRVTKIDYSIPMEKNQLFDVNLE